MHPTDARGAASEGTSFARPVAQIEIMFFTLHDMDSEAVYTDPACDYCPMKTMSDTSITFKLLSNFAYRSRKILLILFEIRACEIYHVNMICKQCGKVEQCHNVIQHVFYCDHGIYRNGVPCVDIRITENIIKELCLDLVAFAKRFPQLLCIKINPVDLIDPDTHNTDIDYIPTDNGRFVWYVDREFYPEIMQKMADGVAQCVSCDMYYDSFPTIKECKLHFMDCHKKHDSSPCEAIIIPDNKLKLDD